MSIRQLLVSNALAALVVCSAAAGAAPAQEDHKSWCVLASFQVSQVGSVYTSEHVGKQVVQHLAGAKLFLPAQPGLTPEWIRASIARHTSSSARSNDCPLDVQGATTSIVSGGTGFWVQITAKDSDAAKEILGRARELVR